MRTKIDGAISSKMANMSLFAAILIVATHVGPESVGLRVPWLYVLLKKGLCLIAMPWFFFASGFFLMNRYGEHGWYKTAVKRRVRTLVVPYVFWCLFAVGLSHCWTLMGLTAYTPPYGNIWEFLDRTFGLASQLPLHGVLWFIRDLFVLVLMAPLFVAIVKRWPGTSVVMMFVLGWASHWIEMFLGLPNLFLYSAVPFDCFPYFLIGIAARYYDLNLNVKRGWAILLLCLSLLLSVCASRCGVEVVIYPMKCLGLIGIWGLMTSIRFPAWLLGAQFPLYVMHWIVLTVWAGICKRFGCEGGYIGSIVVVSVVCIALSVTIRKVSPRFSGLIFGGR